MKIKKILILLGGTLISIRTGSKWISWSGTIAFRLFHFWFWTRFLFVSCLGEMFIVFFISICIFSENFSFMEFFSFFWLFMCLREYYYILSSVSSNECSLGVLRDWIYVKETDLNVLSPYNQATNQSLNKPIPIWTGQGS